MLHAMLAKWECTHWGRGNFWAGESAGIILKNGAQHPHVLHVVCTYIHTYIHTYMHTLDMYYIYITCIYIYYGTVLQLCMYIHVVHRRYMCTKVIMHL